MGARNRYHIDFSMKWANIAAVFAGLGFFLLCVYYFGFTNLVDCGFGEILFSMLLPMVLLASFVVFLRVLRYNAAVVFGGMGCVYCLLMLIRSFSYGSVINTIVAVVWYLLASIVCLRAISGQLSDYSYMAAAFLIPAIIRLVFIDVFKYLFTLSFVAFIPEAAALSGLVAFGLFAFCVKPVPVKRSAKQ